MRFGIRKLSVVLCILVILLDSGCSDTDLGLVTEAGKDAFRAVTLDDAQVHLISSRVAQQSDLEHTVAPPGHPQERRLQRLTDAFKTFDGHTFNFKVYLSSMVNAFALADGSIRFYSGLMDMMDDEELLFVVAHEMGHIIEDHAQERLRLAFAGSAVRKAIASQQNEVGVIARSVVGALAEKLINAQFSQNEERQADRYGAAFLERQGYGTEPAVSALNKLAALGSGHSFLSSHPAPDARAERLQAKTNQDPSPSLVSRLLDWVKSIWPL